MAGSSTVNTWPEDKRNAAAFTRLYIQDDSGVHRTVNTVADSDLFLVDASGVIQTNDDDTGANTFVKVGSRHIDY